MLILVASIVDKERLCVMKEKNSAQHVFLTPVSHEFRVTPRVPDRNAEMMVAPAHIIGNPWLCPSKHKNPRFAITTDLVLDKCRPRLGTIDHHARQNTLRGTAPCHSTTGVEHVHRGILIASDIAKR